MAGVFVDEAGSAASEYEKVQAVLDQAHAETRARGGGCSS
jgi:hypothetical protein